MKKVLSMVLVVILLSSITVVGFAEEKSNVIRISTPELLVCNKSTSSLPSQAYLFYVTVCDWAQYAKAEITVSFNHEVLSCLWKEYPAMGDYVPPVEKERYEDDKRVFSVSYAESPLYQDKKDISFDFMFGARATGAHNLVFEAVAYDKDGNKVKVDLQFDNEIYPEVLSVEETGVNVLDALPVKQTTICENYGITVQDI
ncbi:MAG: hypothetical protein IKL09_05815, partial [Clostridia bacterium]|nr:hypothetical protein [Clostridia bacterium]